MKQLCKVMLAAFTVLSLVSTSFAWEFNASGSSSATYKRETSNSGTSESKDVITNQYASSAGGVTASVSHSDGYANSVTFSYTTAWNSDAGNFDESVSVSGTKKVGNWTASTRTTQHMQKDIGPGADDNAAVSKPVSSQPTASFNLTDGSITYKFGDTTHLSTAEKAVNGPMSGQIDAEARVDSFEGFSVGLTVGSGIITVAFDENTDSDIFGDSDTSLTLTCRSNNTGYGFNFSGDIGVDFSFTIAIGSATPDVTNCTGDNSSNSAFLNTIGMGFLIPIESMNLAFDIEYTAWNSKIMSNETKDTIGGLEVSFTIPLSNATAGINLSSQEKKTISGEIDTANTSTAGTEIWYTMPIGPLELSIGYGISGVTTGCSTCSVSSEITSTTSQLGAEMTMIF